MSEEAIEPGYKRTELGVIPENWNLALLGDVIDVYRGGSPRPIQDYLTTSAAGINWIKIGDVGVGKKYIDSTEEKIKPDGVRYSREVSKGDFLLSNSMSFGRPYISQVDGCVHDGWLVLQNYASTFHQEFLYYLLSSKLILDQYSQRASGSSVLNLNKELVASVYLIAPSKAEQAAIAETLSDVDALLDALDRLIAKKRDIKQGAMQALLTGRVRLPGFEHTPGYKRTEVGLIPEDWEVTKLGEVLKIKHGKSQKNIVEPGGLYPILATGGEIGRTNTPLYLGPSVLIGRKGTIDIPRYMDSPFWTVDTLFYSEIFENSDAKFLYYKFIMIDWYSYNEASGVPSLNAKTIENIEISVPETKREQHAIAEVLSDMDAEIDTLEKRRAKLRDIKQGMMQELLTGHIRLVQPQEQAQEDHV